MGGRQPNGSIASLAVAPRSCSLCGRAVMAAGRPEAQDHPPENGFTALEHSMPRLLPHIDSSVLPSLGGFGKHQKQLVVLTWIPALFIGFSQFSDYFLLAHPNGTCVQPLANHSNWTAPFPPVTSSGDASALQLKSNGTPGEGYGDGSGMLCDCKEWKLELQTGLSQNVVTKVTSAHQRVLQKKKLSVHHHNPHHPVSTTSQPVSIQRLMQLQQHRRLTSYPLTLI